MPTNSPEFNEASFREAYAQYLDECRRNEERRERAAMQEEVRTPLPLTTSYERSQPIYMEQPCPPPEATITVRYVSPTPDRPVARNARVEEIYVPYPPASRLTISGTSSSGTGSTRSRVQPSENMRWTIYPEELVKRVTALGNEF